MLMRIILFTACLTAVLPICSKRKVLDYLPTSLKDDLIKSLFSEPTNNIFDICSSLSTTCCGQTAKTKLYEIIDEELNMKMKIWKTNFGIFYKFVLEHERNFKHFEVENETISEIFANYRRFTETFSFEVQEIIEKSLAFSWNGYCNYYCNPEADKLCSEKEGKYECKINGDDLEEFERMMERFLEKRRDLANSIEGIYGELREKSKGVVADAENVKLMEKSLNDGLNAAINLFTQPFFCEGKEINCEALQKKLCVPYKCFDDMFFSINNKSFINYDSELIDFHFSKSDIMKVDTIFGNNDEDLKELIENLDVLANGYFLMLTGAIAIILLF